MINKFSKEVIEDAKNYVYAFKNTEDNKIFYVGRGKGNRVFGKHNDATEEKIKEIEDSRNGKLERIILRYGMTESAAREVESAFIDFFKKENLTNLINGYENNDNMTVEEFEKEHKLEKIEGITEKVILIKINKSYEELNNLPKEIYEEELYDKTRKVWKINENRANSAEYVFALNHSKVIEVYKIHNWKQVTEDNYRDLNVPEQLIGRCFFNGELADDEIRNKYIGKTILDNNSQNPIRYINC